MVLEKRSFFVWDYITVDIFCCGITAGLKVPVFIIVSRWDLFYEV